MRMLGTYCAPTQRSSNANTCAAALVIEVDNVQTQDEEGGGVGESGRLCDCLIWSHNKLSVPYRPYWLQKWTTNLPGIYTMENKLSKSLCFKQRTITTYLVDKHRVDHGLTSDQLRSRTREAPISENTRPEINKI